jgi:RNA-directed DNA polymerase
VSSYYWSSSTNANNTGNAWNINFNNGNDNNNNKSSAYYVRAVRGGKCRLLSFEAIYSAYLDCRKRKRGTINALRFEYDALGNLFDLALEIQKGTYRPSRSVCFITRSPKLREVFAADFRDRVVHHLVVRELEKIWEPCFIHDSYACRNGKGTHDAVKRLRRFMLKATRNQKRRAFFMQFDIRSFFMSIDKEILFSMLHKKIKSAALLYLVSGIVFHDPVSNYIFKGNAAMLKAVPPHKSLFKTGPMKGLPIGNFTSQFFANVYLNHLDQFVKHRLGCRFYLRYVDDFILLHESEDQLKCWKDRIVQFLAEDLLLQLKENPVVRSVSEGCDFLGYVVRPGYVLSRRRVVNNLKYRLALFRDRIITRLVVNNTVVWKITLAPEIIDELRQVISSYFGHFKHADSHSLVQSVFAKHTWLNEMFLLRKGKLVERLKHGGTFRSLRGQVGFFMSRFEGHVLFFRIGMYIEVFDEDALLMNKLFGFSLKKDFRRMRYTAGFPRKLKQRFLKHILSAGFSVVFIDEGSVGRYLMERYPVAVYRTARRVCA